MNLKEDILNNHILFEEKYPTKPEINKIRTEALSLFEKSGFPSKKDEDWKYTNIQPFLNESYQFSPISTEINYDDLKKYFFHEIDTYKLVFINGHFNSFLSETTHEGKDICILSSALNHEKYHSKIDRYFNSSHDISDSFSTLNTAFANEGAYIYIPKGIAVSKPIQLMFFNIANVPQNIFSQPRNLIILDKNASVQIIEKHQTIGNIKSFTNEVTEVFMETNSHMDYYKIQSDTENSVLIDNHYITQKKDTIASVHTFSFGGKLIRNNLNFYQNGENGNSILKGISLLNRSQLADNHTLVEHNAPNSESHELYRGVYRGESKGVFNGKVKVDKTAQKINAYQQNNNILLSDNASIDTKPQLEIFADDVKCSHGCTVGQLNKEAMFYLQSRGIPEKEAQALLTYGFLADILETVKIPIIQTTIKKLIADKLEVNFGDNV